MQIEYLQDAPYVEVSLEGTVLQVAGINIDLGERQADSQVIVDITRRDEEIVEGVNNHGVYVANILLPPVEYEDVDTGEVGEDGNPRIEKRALPLDTNRVVLKLWQLKPDRAGSDTPVEEE